MDVAEHDVLEFMTFTEQHRVKLYSSYPLERLNVAQVQITPEAA